MGFRRIWFPGAGTSVAPRAFAELGFDVVSSDFSPVAVAAQEKLAAEPLQADLESYREAFSLEPEQPTKMVVRNHDSRVSLDLPPFDVVLNQRAYQGLSSNDRTAVARTHFDAIRPAGWAMFETMNIPADRRDELEAPLITAGFALPGNESNRWYRAALAETGIPFVIILGRALVPGPNRSEKSQAQLDALTKEFAERAQRESDRDAERLKAPEIRIAHVIYNTG
jgi:hypothetical protein